MQCSGKLTLSLKHVSRADLFVFHVVFSGLVEIMFRIFPCFMLSKLIKIRGTGEPNFTLRW